MEFFSGCSNPAPVFKTAKSENNVKITEMRIIGRGILFDKDSNNKVKVACILK